MKANDSVLHPARLFLAKFQKSHLILPVSLMMATSVSGIGLAMVFYLTDHFGVAPGLIGVSSALMWVAYLSGTLLMQPLAQKLLPRYSLIISAFASSAFAFLIRAAAGPWLAIAAYTGLGFAVAMFWPPIMGWLSAGVEGAALGRRISVFNMAWSTGVIVGPYLAGLIAEVDSGLALLLGGGLFAFVAIIVVVASLLLDSIRADLHRDPPRSTITTADESTPLRFPSWTGAFGAYVVLGALTIAFPLYAREILGLRESAIGGVFLTRGLASTIGFLLLGRTVAWHFRTLPIVVPIGALLVLSTILWLGSSPLAFRIIVPVVGLVVAGSYSVSVFHGVAGSAQRARRMSIHEVLLTAGVIVGSLGSGAIYQRAGINAVFLACALLLTAVLTLQLVLSLRAPSRR